MSLDRYRQRLQRVDGLREVGRITQVVGLLLESQGPSASVGDVCLIQRRGHEALPAEVVGFRESRTLLMPLGEMSGIQPGSEVVSTNRPLSVGVSRAMVGRILDGLGRPLDGGPPLVAEAEVLVHRAAPTPLQRRRVEKALSLGIRSLDACLTSAVGGRIGIFAGSGVGKSTLLGMVARNTAADLNVIALIGERGREVLDFVEKDLGPDGLARSIVVAVTSDQSALSRITGALVATAIAECFRDLGNDVLLMMDSVTRFAQAGREIGLAVGEPPATRGYPPSVFAALPRLLERAGTAPKGSITGLYTVLVEGDDLNEPIADSVRSILDGHVVLSRDLAARNHYPPVDVLRSVSRLMSDVVGQPHAAAAAQLREVLATYEEAEDLINLGAYQSGSNPDIDRARALIQEVRGFLRQRVEEESSFEQTVARLRRLFDVGRPEDRLLREVPA